MTDRPTSLRCAIYTRTSSDERLDQAFNSLHAQREACEAYIRSQIGEGWVLAPDRYDDGGYSGGSMERPALKRLLSAVTAKQVDAVVVYKVDRLSRFLPDFARIVESFDKQDVSFISVTQAFNTTTSMGRLTLNMLLSFAQFERELTGERIRDKIAASKAKGMWMGGKVPTGYCAPGDASRALVVNPDEAATVRLMFERLLALGSIFALQKWLDAEGVRSKRWVSEKGRPMGGLRFSTGALRHLLRNRIYVAEIVHKGTIYPGRHEAIVDRATYDAVQSVLESSSRRHRDQVSRAKRMLLDGLLFDVDGLPMTPVFGGAGKLGPYQYYASLPLPRGGVADDRDDAIRRVPVRAVDDVVVAWAKKLGDLRDADPDNSEIRKLIARVEVHPSAVHIVIRISALPGRLGPGAAMRAIRDRLKPEEQALVEPSHVGLIRLLLPIRLVVRGGRTWLTGLDDRAATVPKIPNPKLVRDLRAAHAILRACGIDAGAVAPHLNARAPMSGRDRKLVQLAFLAPDIQSAILCGKIQAWKPKGVPLSWAKQRLLVSS